MKLRRLCEINQKNAMILCWVMFLFAQLPMGQANTNAPANEILLEVAFQQIGQKFNVFFSYDRTLVSNVKVQYESDKHENIKDALSYVFEQTEFKFQIFDQRYVAVYRDSKEGIDSMKKMIDHFQEIVDSKSEAQEKKVAPVPLPTLRPNSINTIEDLSLIHI